jgi:glycosyltransferase involved in cell wall biosynthesis
MYHGSLVERNGLELAIEAFEKVRSAIPSAELRIYGNRNAFLDRMMDRARAKGLADAVAYLGPKPQTEIVKAIEACDVGIIPNKRSIFTELNTPTRIFEYLALGKPVIAPMAGGITDYFDKDSIIFFELGNAEDLATKMKQVFLNPARAFEIVHRGQEIYSSHAWRSEKSGLMSLITRLLREGDSRIPVPESH